MLRHEGISVLYDTLDTEQEKHERGWDSKGTGKKKRDKAQSWNHLSGIKGIERKGTHKRRQEQGILPDEEGGKRTENSMRLFLWDVL